MADNPLSPHLQIYRPQLTSVLSIMHRATGVFLSLGTVILLYWLVAAALGANAYADAQRCIGSMPSQIVLAAWTFALDNMAEPAAITAITKLAASFFRILLMSYLLSLPFYTAPILHIRGRMDVAA